MSRSRHWPPAALYSSTRTDLLADLNDLRGAENSGSVVGLAGHGPNLIKLSHSQVAHVPPAARGPSGTFAEVQASAEGGLDEGETRPCDEGSMLENTRVPEHVLWDFNNI